MSTIFLLLRTKCTYVVLCHLPYTSDFLINARLPVRLAVRPCLLAPIGYSRTRRTQRSSEVSLLTTALQSSSVHTQAASIGHTLSVSATSIGHSLPPIRLLVPMRARRVARASPSSACSCARRRSLTASKWAIKSKICASRDLAALAVPNLTRSRSRRTRWRRTACGARHRTSSTCGRRLSASFSSRVICLRSIASTSV